MNCHHLNTTTALKWRAYLTVCNDAPCVSPAVRSEGQGSRSHKHVTSSAQPGINMPPTKRQTETNKPCMATPAPHPSASSPRPCLDFRLERIFLSSFLGYRFHRGALPPPWLRSMGADSQGGTWVGVPSSQAPGPDGVLEKAVSGPPPRGPHRRSPDVDPATPRT